jgi:3-methyl-2-oxobutanoate hydroxymethyltransferase
MPHIITLSDIQSLKGKRPISVLTAYDYPFAKILDEAGVDVILIGDSLANVVLGLESTRDVTIDDMVYHARAVGRAVRNAFVVGDMPFSSYQVEGADIVGDAKKLIAAGCDAVKVEWFDQCLDTVKQLRNAGIAVMGHIGLTPQTAAESGGFKVRGKTAGEAKRLYDQALALQDAGCFSMVLECVPDRIAKVITENVKILTIGIGAGPDCDGQVLVLHDALGILKDHQPKFVKGFCDIVSVSKEAVSRYIHEVKGRDFPDHQQSYSVDDQEFQLFLQKVHAR